MPPRHATPGMSRSPHCRTSGLAVEKGSPGPSAGPRGWPVRDGPWRVPATARALPGPDRLGPGTVRGARHCQGVPDRPCVHRPGRPRLRVSLTATTLPPRLAPDATIPPAPGRPWRHDAGSAGAARSRPAPGGPGAVRVVRAGGVPVRRRRSDRPRRRGRPAPVIVLARDQAGLYEFLKERQEAAGKGRVILDRRLADRRRTATPVTRERRREDRRAPVPDAARALMSVLGFAVLHPEGDTQPAGRTRRGTPARGKRSRGRGPSRRRSPAASGTRRRPPPRGR